MDSNRASRNIPVPHNARFVVYLLPGVKYTLQKTLLSDTDEVPYHKIPRTWKDIKRADEGGYAYGVRFKDEKNQELPHTYIIRAEGEVKDLMNMSNEEEYNIDADFEQAEASRALAGTGITTYIKAQLKEILAFIAFDPKTMIVIKQEKEDEKAESAIPYTPVKIRSDFGVLRRPEAYFVKQDMSEETFVQQPFITRSDEQASIDFVAEYYRYCCDPRNYPGTQVREIGYSEEWFDITSKVLEHMSAKLGTTFSELKVYPFFEKINEEGRYRPTHDLLCHMFLMNRMARVPGYLASGHLGDPEKSTEQFNYYTSLLIHDNPNVIPNQAGLIKCLKRIVSIVKKKSGRRLVGMEIDVKDIMDLLSEGPYEGLLREQLCLVNNITQGDTIGFKLTPTGAMFLYMCCPNIR